MNLAIKSPSYCLKHVRVKPQWKFVRTVIPECQQNNFGVMKLSMSIQSKMLLNGFEGNIVMIFFTV